MEMMVFFVFLLFLSSFFSASEIAFFSLTQAQARLMLERKQRSAGTIWRLKKHPQRLLITILIGNNVVNVFAASLATVVATRVFGSSGLGIATGVVTLFILVFGEIAPKSIAQRNSVLVAQIAAPVLYALSVLFFPIIQALVYFNELLARLFRVGRIEEATEEEIRSLSRISAEKGSIHYREHAMIENVFRFHDVLVRNVMTPRYRMVSLNGAVPVEQIAHFVSGAGYARYPVYEGNEDNIVGYIHINDIMRALNSPDRGKPVREFVREVTVVRDTDKIEAVFRKMARTREHLMLVERDREIIGVVTLEDLVEEIFGEIVDETDAREDAQF